jgi:hypothetical protein
MRVWIGLLLAVAAGSATAQAAETRYPALDGIAPFAGADVTWFERHGLQDKLTFYSYWTGYYPADAKLHWVVRRDSNAQESVAVMQFGPGIPSQGRVVPAQPAKIGPTTWIWSDTCPALIEAMGSFRIGESGFSATPYPPMKPPPPQDADKIVISSADFHIMTFWAQLSSTRIETKAGPMEADGAGGFVYRIAGIFDDGICTLTAKPEIPKPS